MSVSDAAVLITAVAGALLGTLTWWRQRGVDKVEKKAKEQITVLEGYDELVKNMLAQIESLSERLDECEIVKASLEERFRALENQLPRSTKKSRGSPG